MKEMTLINIILDRSGSMSFIAQETIGMFNRFLKEQQELPGYAELSLVQFDDLYETNYICKPIKKCPNLEYNKTYMPRGMTALYDAIGKTINSVGQSLSKKDEEERPERVLFAIITDGIENASKEFTVNTIKEMITHQKENTVGILYFSEQA